MKMKKTHEYCKGKLEPARLYKIGMFAGINHVTIKALRYYDEQELLKPAYVDEMSGYRYYSASQIADLHQILSLRNMGFSLEDIKAIQGGRSEKDLLLAKKQGILKEISLLTARLAQVESYLAKEEPRLSSPVLVKTLPEVIAISMQIKLSSYDCLFDMMPMLGAKMEELGCVCSEPDYCFTNYLEAGYKEEDILVEICEAVTEKKEDSELIKFKVFPEVKAACIFHKGSYNTLATSYEVLLSFIEENNYEICGNIRESYIDGVWNKESDEDWLTEIQIPVSKKE